MNAKQLLKGLFIAVPMMTLAACSSTNGVDAADTTNGGSAAAGQVAGSDNGVEIDGIERVKSPAEIRQEQVAALAQVNMVFFEFDDSRISASAADVLQQHADFLVKNPNVTVTIEGHCDERGTPEYNIALGERRAKAVVQYLQNLGVSGAQLSTVSYGEEKPLIRASSNEAYAKNRRGVIVY